tara:strand:- start:70 stop:642 length:573 start_codon:yes stop_codon:yes gene_type:complete
MVLAGPTNAFSQERMIGFEMWSGGEIEKPSNIRYPEVDFKFGYKNRHRIKGPFDWKNPKTGETLKVYERSRFSKKAGKEIKQLWTITNKGQCLGRVFDSRKNRQITNGCKFPLGKWKAGESRTFTSDYYDKSGGRYQREKTIRIIELGKDERDCLKFKWKATQNGSSIDDNIYEYCYRRGLVRVNGKERF